MFSTNSQSLSHPRWRRINPGAKGPFRGGLGKRLEPLPQPSRSRRLLPQVGFPLLGNPPGVVERRCRVRVDCLLRRVLAIDKQVDCPSVAGGGNDVAALIGALGFVGESRRDPMPVEFIAHDTGRGGEVRKPTRSTWLPSQLDQTAEVLLRQEYSGSGGRVRMCNCEPICGRLCQLVQHQLFGRSGVSRESAKVDTCRQSRIKGGLRGVLNRHVYRGE